MDQATVRGGELRRLTRASAAAWLSAAGLFALALGPHYAGVVHPPGWPTVALLVVFAAATFAVWVFGLRAVGRGPRRGRAAVVTSAGLNPALVLVVLAVLGVRQFRDRDFRPTAAVVVGRGLMTGAAEAWVGHAYPHRLESDRVVMFYADGIVDPTGDLAEIDRHVARLETVLGRPLRAKVCWVRGPLFGARGLASPGFALGSAGPGVEDLDRHEVAHCVLVQHADPGRAPPSVLNEGWATFAEGRPDPAAGARRLRDDLAVWSTLPPDELATFLPSLTDPDGLTRLIRQRQEQGDRRQVVREMFSDYWFHRHTGPVYGVGGSLTAYLIRVHGGERFAAFALRVRPGTADADCEAVFGVTLDGLERQFWADADARR